MSDRRALGLEGAGCFSPAAQVHVEDWTIPNGPRSAGIGPLVTCATVVGRRTHCDVRVHVPATGLGDGLDWTGTLVSLWAESGGILTRVASGTIAAPPLEAQFAGANQSHLFGLLLSCRGFACDAFHVRSQNVINAVLSGGRLSVEAWGDGV